MHRLPGLAGGLSKRVSGRTPVPKQNRPLVRDGRLQAKKKRTDRSYLRGNGAPVAVAEEPEAAEAPLTAEEVEESPVTPEAEMSVAEADAAEETAVGAAAPAGAQAAAGAAQAAAPRGGRLPSTVRALQQQGVRKRREFDVHALALRDSKYALHEMRRIFILAAMVITTLVVLGIVMR